MKEIGYYKHLSIAVLITPVRLPFRLGRSCECETAKNLINLVLDLIPFGGWFCGDCFPSYNHVFIISGFCFSLFLSPLPPSPAYKKSECASVEYKAVAYLRFIIVFAVASSVINTISCRYNV